MATEIGHYVGNKRVAGTSGRAGDVTNPATGEVTAKVAFASRSRDRCRGADRQEGAACLGGDAAAPPPARDVQPQEPDREAHRRSRPVHVARARQDLRRRQGRGRARARGRRVLLRHRPSHARRLHRAGRLRHGHLVDPPAGRRGGGHHAVQLPDHDPVLDGRHGGGLRQRLHPEALGEGPERADAAGRAVRRGRRAGRHLPGAERRQGRGRCAAQASRRAGDLLRRLDGDRRVRLSPGHAAQQTRAGAVRRQEPHGDHARRRPRPGDRRADRRGLRRGRRALHGDLGRRRGGRCRRQADRPSWRRACRRSRSGRASIRSRRWARW